MDFVTYFDCAKVCKRNTRTQIRGIRLDKLADCRIGVSIIPAVYARTRIQMESLLRESREYCRRPLSFPSHFKHLDTHTEIPHGFSFTRKIIFEKNHTIKYVKDKRRTTNSDDTTRFLWNASSKVVQSSSLCATYIFLECSSMNRTLYH